LHQQLYNYEEYSSPALATPFQVQLAGVAVKPECGRIIGLSTVNNLRRLKESHGLVVMLEEV